MSGAPMRISLSIVPFQDPDDRVPFRRTFTLCALAEELGFDTVMVGHHHFLPRQISDPFTLLAGLAARTERIRLATAVLLLPLHHPLEVAERVATLDELSGGRVSLGVGSGWNPTEYAAFGSPLNNGIILIHREADDLAIHQFLHLVHERILSVENSIAFL